MKRVIVWSIIIIVTILVLDILFGVAFNSHMKNHTLPGDYEMADHLLRNSDNEDIVVLGSSVALNSINTKTLQDSLGIKSFNGGANGQSFPFHLTLLKALLGQHAPKHIILGIIPDNLSTTGKGARYNFLAPYYGMGISDIDSRLEEGDAIEQILLKSNFYRLNRIWFRIFLYNFVQPGIKGENGFVAKPIPPQFPERMEIVEHKSMSAERRNEFEEFVKLCKDNDVNLTVVFTPQCIISNNTAEDSIVTEVRNICEKNGVRLFDDRVIAPFNADNTLFYDDAHININGSKIYTDTILNRLK